MTDPGCSKANYPSSLLPPPPGHHGDFFSLVGFLKDTTGITAACEGAGCGNRPISMVADWLVCLEGTDHLANMTWTDSAVRLGTQGVGQYKDIFGNRPT
jgi:hypothetical protein